MERGTYAGRGEWETTSQCGSTEDDHDCAESVPSALPSPSPSTEPAIVTSAEDEEELDSDELNEHDEIEMDSEPVDRYDWNTYYPLTIGEVLVRRYKIVHKLGWGGCSTVWMAHDTRDRKYVALKILIAAERGHLHGESDEINERLRGQGKSNLVTYEKTFELPGSKMSHVHRVLVFPIMGSSLDQARYEMRTSTHSRHRMSAAWQLLLSLKDLHQAKIVHGDLNLGAVMWGMKSIDECDTTTVYKHFGQPRQFDLGKMWKRGDLVKQITIPEKLREDKIYLGDFGMAIEDGTAVNTKVQRPAMFCAPERFHNVNPSFASDMWSYMWIFAYLYLGFYPINGCGADVLPCMVETLGPLPEQWRGSFKYYDVPGEDGWYDQSRVPVDHATWMSMVARREPAISQEEQQLAVRVLNKLFCYEPTRRLSAAQLLEDPDFLDLMGRYVSIS